MLLSANRRIPNPHIASKHRGSEAMWGFKQNLQSFDISSPNFVKEKEKKL